MRASWRLSAFFFAVISISTTAFSFAFTTSYGYGLSSSNMQIEIKALSAKGDDDTEGNNNGGGSGALGKTYNDDFLFNLHMMTQQQKIRDYSASNYYVDTNSLWNLAWHDSFVRNGLSDFVPPLTDNLNVLIVGGPASQPEIDVVAVVDGDSDTITETSATPIEAGATEGLAQADAQDSSCSFLAAVFDDGNNNSNTLEGEDSTSDLGFESYDCIMDQGLIADLIARGDHQFDDTVGTAANNNKEELGRLLLEATKRIKEMGIYVASTPPLSGETKEYLTEVGQLLGLQWVFDMDGISDSNVSVNVARYSKYLKDELPPGWQSFRKLAKDGSK